jgi:DNA sulfur modification protein DndC
MSLIDQVEVSDEVGEGSPAEGFGAKLKAIRRDLREEYLQPHDKPWIIGFSGGKDSTLLAHLVIECLLAIPPDERKRRVYLVCNDTLVESPVFQEFVNHLLGQIADNLETLGIPVEVVRTSPKVEESFWVNLLGRGYPAPNRTFRWCTDRMKIRPTSRFIRELVTHHGEAILLLGVRRAESSARAANIAKRNPRNLWIETKSTPVEVRLPDQRACDWRQSLFAASGRLRRGRLLAWLAADSF